MKVTYKIIRFYRKGGHNKVVRRHLTLADAKKWCSRTDTKKESVWFDGFTKETK